MTNPPVLTEDMRDEMELTMVEITRLIEQGREFEAMEKAKAVCDTLDSLEQDSDVEEIRTFMLEVTDQHLAA